MAAVISCGGQSDRGFRDDACFFQESPGAVVADSGRHRSALNRARPMVLGLTVRAVSHRAWLPGLLVREPRRAWRMGRSSGHPRYEDL